jgi:hypothetical protein
MQMAAAIVQTARFLFIPMPFPKFQASVYGLDGGLWIYKREITLGMNRAIAYDIGPVIEGLLGCRNLGR